MVMDRCKWLDVHVRVAVLKRIASGCVGGHEVSPVEGFYGAAHKVQLHN